MADAEPRANSGDPASALTADFSETARALFSAGSVEDTLSQIVRLSVATIEGCDFAGIFLVDGVKVTTPTHTDPLVVDVDLLQQLHQEGPCLDAVKDGLTYYAGDLSDDPRWPLFGPAATEQGVRSVLALPLYAHRTVGALNLYARYPEAFGVMDRARGQLLAALAALAFTSAQSHEDEERRATNLHAALDTREVIGQAQGILMERERISAEQAFDILRLASQHLNLKLRAVAQALVETGERPDTGQA
jgi:GAF domain-containing protein